MMNARNIELAGSQYPFNTRYVRMVVASDQVPWELNVLASAAHWILLAGYLVIPGTFTSLSKSSTVQSELGTTDAGEALLKTVQNPPILVIGCIFFVIGTGISLLLYRINRENYIWLINRLFLPTLLNASAGLLTTLISIYTGHSGSWSVVALLAALASGLSALLSLIALGMYYKKLLDVKSEHRDIVRAGSDFI
ncbi:uncharacterized protein N7484_007020 [Penicillium longicatenatum]|uniref:uncharacterized protein n=1 Tax=Penicillium longicatenatum TaxID=1561947 RepID=UPI002548FD1A|nr:uncharacterized protein N7484_007020 [Penicillium longicatenatum]KAJ5639158.1 hypothetical protein N7484_007020 [Penicillium longicatenatum]